MELSWVTVCWSLLAGGYLAIGTSQLIAWSNQTKKTSRLALGGLGISLALVALFELSLMRAQTPAEYSLLLRWIHVPLFATFISIVLFVRAYLGAGRLWLVYGVIGLRTLTLILAFYLDPNLHYEQIRLEFVDLFGVEVASVAVGVPSRWRWIGPMGSLFLLLFIMDAMRVCWRRGGRDSRRRAAAVGGSLAFCVLFASVHGGSIHAGLISSVYLISPPFLVVMVAIGFEMSAEGRRSALLALRLRKSEDDLQISEERLAYATNAAKFGLWEWDIARDAFWATTEARALFGIGLSEKIDFTRFLHTLRQEDRDTARAATARALETGEGFEIDLRVTQADGQVRWIQSRGGVFPGEAGKAARMHGVSFDITERRQAELEIEQQRSELAHLARVALLSELSGSIAHEMNQPLAAILSNAQAALRFMRADKPDFDEVREILEDIVSDDKRAGEVIQGLRLLLKRGVMRREPFDMNQVVLDVLRLVHSTIVTADVSVSTALAPDLPPAIGDRVQMQQVVLNLVMNGCDAMVDIAVVSGRKLLIRTELTEERGIQVCVADAGTGIPPEHMDRIFQSFFSTKAHGLGLGLSVCRQIVSAHNGRLWFKNNAGPGTTFCVEVPSESNVAP